MTTAKKTVTMDEELIEQARQRADGNFSAFVAEAVGEKIARERRREAMQHMFTIDDAEAGPLDPHAVAHAAAELRALDA